jgi:hypothetical protein
MNEFLIDVFKDEQYRIYDKLSSLLENFRKSNFKSHEFAGLLLDEFDIKEKK